MITIFRALCVFSGMVFFFSCAEKKQQSSFHAMDTGILHQNQYQLTKIIIYDVFSPPVASRIYAYTSIAAYEAIRFAEPGYPSLAAQLHGFADMPKPDKKKNTITY